METDVNHSPLLVGQNPQMELEVNNPPPVFSGQAVDSVSPQPLIVVGEGGPVLENQPSEDRNVPFVLATVESDPNRDRNVTFTSTNGEIQPNRDRNLTCTSTTTESQPNRDRNVTFTSTNGEIQPNRDRNVTFTSTSRNNGPNNSEKGTFTRGQQDVISESIPEDDNSLSDEFIVPILPLSLAITCCIINFALPGFGKWWLIFCFKTELKYVILMVRGHQ